MELVGAIRMLKECSVWFSAWFKKSEDFVFLRIAMFLKAKLLIAVE
jgi:hypothetical protein